MSGRTKGWRAEGSVVDFGDGGCDLYGAPNAEERARLFAAAPDLLEALLGVVRVADRATVEFDAARAAIAKATGETL